MEALVRLAQGHSVLRVALDLGYGSHSAFSAMFRRVMGVAPSDYFRRRLIGCAERIAQRLHEARATSLSMPTPQRLLPGKTANIGHRAAVAAFAERMLVIVLNHKRLL
jgi:hypothetical protein